MADRYPPLVWKEHPTVGHCTTCDLVRLLFDLSDWSDPMDAAEQSAQAILARWRLVPVEEAWQVNVTECLACQHRAADELTHHDQTAGHYGSKPSRDCQDEDCIKPRTHNGPCVGIGGIDL